MGKWVKKTNLRGKDGVPGTKGTPGAPGSRGPAGPANTLTIGTVSSAEEASASIRGAVPSQVLDLVLPQGPQGLPGVNGIENDEAVAGYIETSGTSATKTALDANFAPRGELDYNSFSRAYRKRIVHSLPFKFPEYDEAQALWGNLYPQAFQVDLRADELFVNYNSAAFNMAAVFKWSTGEYKTCFGWATAYVTEGFEILYEGSKRYLYTRAIVNGLGKYDITTLPENLSTVPAASTINTDQGINFTYREGIWTVTDQSQPIGAQISRGNFKKLNENFQPVGTFSIPEMMAGGNPHKYRDNTIPKMQGFCDMGGSYAFVIGGFYGAGAVVTPYEYQGIRIFSAQGHVLADNLMDPRRMISILQSAGLNPTRVENEGVQLVDGKIISFTVTSSYGTTPGNTTEGLVFFEEFSDHPQALDFSSAAVMWTAPDIDRLQSGRHPRQVDRTLRDPVSFEVLNTVPKIIDYMKAVNQSEFSFYSSSVSVTDVNGVKIPSGHLVRISNGNNGTFYMEWAAPVRRRSFQIYTSGGVLVQLPDDSGTINLTLSAGVVPFDAGGTPNIRRIAGITFLEGIVRGVPANPVNFQVGYFHGQYAPSRTKRWVQTTEGENFVRWALNADGYLFIERTSLPAADITTWYPLPDVGWISKNT